MYQSQAVIGDKPITCKLLRLGRKLEWSLQCWAVQWEVLNTPLRKSDLQIQCYCVWFNYTIMLVAAAEMYLCGSLYSCHFLFLYNNPLPVCFPLAFHMNLICFISIFSSHISFFLPPLSISSRSWSCVAPLISCPLLLSICASSKLAYTSKGPVHQHLSHFSDCCEIFRLLWDSPKGVGRWHR